MNLFGVNTALFQAQIDFCRVDFSHSLFSLSQLFDIIYTNIVEKAINVLDIKQFRECIIKPVLSELQLYSKEAEELLVFTCAVESEGGTYIKQVKGPAVGIYQCEPATHTDIWRNYIFNHSHLLSILGMNFGVHNVPDSDKLISDMRYATAIARIHYLRVLQAIPSTGNIDSIYEYYKKFYNTVAGKSSKDKSIAAYNRFIKG